MKDLNERVNETFNLAVYLQMMGAIIPGSDWAKVKEVVTSVHDFIKESDEDEVNFKLPLIKQMLIEMTQPFMDRYPLKVSVDEVAFAWNELFKNDNNPINNGLEYGWLNQYMDLSSLYEYNYVPYQLKMGLVAHKGFANIEEDFLLKDAFNVFVKSKYNYELLLSYGEEMKKKEEGNSNGFSNETYSQITDLKYEVAAYSRLSVVSFYSFVECFVNSIGFSYLSYNKAELSDKDKELLNGLRKGKFLSLKSKMEIFQKLIRNDKRAAFVVSDAHQITDPFKSFFEYYEQLRNSAVHYSPLKERIWMKPEDWVKKSDEFSKLSTAVALEFWSACFPKLDAPDYIGRLDYEELLNTAEERLRRINGIRSNLN